jgi:CheY-like chemotaxis protein
MNEDFFGRVTVQSSERRGNGTSVADRLVIVVYASSKTTEIVASRTSLTPCILDDDSAQLEMLSAIIVEMGYEPIPTQDPEEALRLVKHGRCRLVFVAVHMPEMDGYEFLDRALRSDPGVHVILMAGEYTLESALEAIRRGASDFLPKPVDRARLRKTLDDVAALYDQRRRVKALEEQLLKDLEFHGIVGRSPVMLEVFDFARKVARHYTNVLLAKLMPKRKAPRHASDRPGGCAVAASPNMKTISAISETANKCWHAMATAECDASWARPCSSAVGWSASLIVGKSTAPAIQHTAPRNPAMAERRSSCEIGGGDAGV